MQEKGDDSWLGTRSVQGASPPWLFLDWWMVRNIECWRNLTWTANSMPFVPNFLTYVYQIVQSQIWDDQYFFVPCSNQFKEFWRPGPGCLPYTLIFRFFERRWLRFNHEHKAPGSTHNHQAPCCQPETHVGMVQNYHPAKWMVWYYIYKLLWANEFWSIASCEFFDVATLQVPGTAFGSFDGFRPPKEPRGSLGDDLEDLPHWAFCGSMDVGSGFIW